MGISAALVILTFLLVLVACQVLLSSNKDLVRARAWGELTHRSFPFIAIALMAAGLPLVQSWQEGWVPVAWVLAFGALLMAANFLSIPLDERRASRAFRSGDCAGAAALYRRLAEKKNLARYWAFLGAALAASEKPEEGVEASTKAIEMDPKYGLAYYNRALILRRMGQKSRAVKDLKKALDVDLPRRFRTGSRSMLEELQG